MNTPRHKTLVTKGEIEAYLHTTRMAVIQALKPGQATCTQIAETLGVHPANLTRHLRILEKAGLIFLKEKKDTGRNTEKYYALCADSFDVAPETSDLSSLKETALACAKSDLAAAIATLPGKEESPVFAKLIKIRVSAKKAAGFAKEIDSLIERFASLENEKEQAFHLNISLYPGCFETEGFQSVHIGSPEETAADKGNTP